MRRSRALLLALACAAPSCGRGGCDEAAERGPAPQLRVELAGCRAIGEGPSCTPGDDGAITLWVRSEDGAEIAVRDGGGPVEVAPAEVGDGLRYHFAPRAGGPVVVEARAGGAVASWTLALEDEHEPEVLKRAAALKAAGKYDEGVALVEGALPGLAEEARGRALGVLGRLCLLTGETERGLGLLRRAMAANERSGRLKDLVWDGLKLARELAKSEGEYGAARATLAGLAGPLEHVGEGRAIADYTRALIARDTGDLRGAARALAAALAQAERLGLGGLEADFRQVRAGVLARTGRLDEAEAELGAILEGRSREDEPERVSRALANLCWIRVLAREAGRGVAEPAASEACRQALRLRRERAPHPEDEANILVNLALAQLQEGAAEEARARLAEVRAMMPEPPEYIAVWLTDIEARVLLETGDAAKALGVWESLAARARRSTAEEALWRARTGAGLALEALGRDEEAVRAYLDAEAALDSLGVLVPLGAGRGAFLGDRERSARRAVGLLVRLGRDAEAFAVARRSRARVLAVARDAFRLEGLSEDERGRWEAALERYRTARRALDREARDSWELPADEAARELASRNERASEARRALEAALSRAGSGREQGAPRPPAPGELLLLYHPATPGWVGFAAQEGRISATVVQLPGEGATPEQWSSALLSPFDARLRDARRLVFLPYGSLRAVDFHALPWQGAPLLAHAPVAYRLDLPGAGAARDAATAERRALIVADPLGDLLAARREADRVRDALETSGGWTITELRGPAVTGDALRGGLAAADLFHFAGHGRFVEGAVWESALPLAGGERLTIADILSLARVPERVVLSGCETARTPSPSHVRAESLGLANAFLTRGSRSVIAAARPVGDELAARIVAAFYRAPAALGVSDPASRLRAAQLALRDALPGADWASYRLVER